MATIDDADKAKAAKLAARRKARVLHGLAVSTQSFRSISDILRHEELTPQEFRDFMLRIEEGIKLVSKACGIAIERQARAKHIIEPEHSRIVVPGGR